MTLGNKGADWLRHGVVLWLVSLALGCSSEAPWNVLLVTLDTTRADFLGCYGKTSAQTPVLDQLAERGTLFESAYTSNPVTQAAHSTILTGVYPMVHGVRDNILFRLPEEMTTLAEHLRVAGYATGAAVGGFPLTREFGTAQGFDFYDDDLTHGRTDFRGRPIPDRLATWYDERPAPQVNDAILSWLREDRSVPFFAWVHYWDPHEPHIAPSPFRELFIDDPYQAEIAYADQSLGALLDALERAGERHRTLVVVTADHGEGRGEHRESTHAFLAYDATLRVPLIVSAPDQAQNRRIAERVGTVDIVPTILDLLDLPSSDQLQGRSLAPLMRQPAASDSVATPRHRTPYYSESLSPRLSHGLGELRALFLGPWKYVHGPRPELFHLGRDPGELRDLITVETAQAESMRSQLQEFLHARKSKEVTKALHDIDEETRQRLAALGYLASMPGTGEQVDEILRSDGEAPQDRVGDINLQSRLRRQLGVRHFAAAERTARSLLMAAPENTFYLKSLVAAQLGLDKPEEAARELLAVTPSAALGPQFLAVGQALFDSGAEVRGLELIRRGIEAGDVANGEAQLARLLLASDDIEGFQQATKRALEADPEHRGSRLERARYYLATDRLREAESDLLRLLRANPIDPEVHLEYAGLLRREGQSEAAERRLLRVLRLAPHWCDPYLELIRLHREALRPAEASEVLGRMRTHCTDASQLSHAATLAVAMDTAGGYRP